MHSAETRNSPPAVSASLWWLHPFWIVAVPLVVISLAAYLLPEPDYRESWRTAKAFSDSDLLLCLAVAAAFSVGCLVASWIDAGFAPRHRLAPGPRDAGVSRRELSILFSFAFIVTIVGYAIWFGSIIRQGGIGMFTNVILGGGGAPDVLKKSAQDSMVTGVTTFTQFGMGTALLGTYLGFASGWRSVRWRLLLLFVLTLVRAVFLSERLSLIEIMLPPAILMIRVIGFGRPGSALRRFLIVAPIAGILGLYVLFTVTEYFRSWSSFYAARSEQSLFSFSLLRLLGYYVTALNNGAIEWQAHGALHFPYSTMEWLWRFPVVGRVLAGMLGGTNNPEDVRQALLGGEGNPELSNPSGIFVVFTDLGITGALLYFTCFGFLARLLYGSYRRGSLLGLFLYSFLFTGLTEQVRIMYLTTGRAFPTWVLLFVVVLLSRPARRVAVSLRKHSPLTARRGGGGGTPPALRVEADAEP
jgi:oligosaccharide repeat unit polymerase